MVRKFNLSSPANLSTSIFSLQLQYKISCSVMRIKELNTNSKLFNTKSKFLPSCFKEKYDHSFGEFSNMSHVMLRLRKLKNVQTFF